ncbi:hypothetical protein CPK_ORF00529 [Chlamydia pneumoniae LPCoLN]|nr:hypothetical protein CPK_ORF00529 [Chlamydia pneumoniae LPCoLN]
MQSFKIAPSFYPREKEPYLLERQTNIAEHKDNCGLYNQ